jgi:hypothetical protein
LHHRIIYIFCDLIEVGDPLNKILLLVAFCTFAALSFTIPALGQEEVQQDLLIQDSGNDTTVNLAGIYSSGYLGVAETVKFTPPRQSWTLDAVQILGWDGYEENGALPDEQIISMEIRDENLNLLYRFTDSQLPYFTFIGQPGIGEIEVPSIPINGDFYVCFYDRGAVDIGLDQNSIESNSYFYNMQTGELVLAEVGIQGTEGLIPVNWIIRAVGH